MGRGECLSAKDPRNNYKIPGIITRSSNLLPCSLPLFASPSTTPLASRKMWWGLTIHSWHMGVVQSKTIFYLSSRFSLQNCSMCVLYGMHNSIAFYYFALHTAFLIGQHTPNLPCKIIVTDLILCLRIGRYGWRKLFL